MSSIELSKKRVVGYVRVSTESQAESGLSVEAQTQKLISYCDLYDLKLVKIITDAGYSAKNLKRPGIEELYRLVADGEVDGVVVSKLDRLTRSMRDLHMLLEGLFNTIDLHSVSEKVDTNSASGRLVLNVLMSVAEWEREAISERTKVALKVKSDRGDPLGRAPYGKRWEEGALVDNPEELEVIKQIHELRAQGFSYRAIQHELKSRGVKNRFGRVAWGLNVLQQLTRGA